MPVVMSQFSAELSVAVRAHWRGVRTAALCCVRRFPQVLCYLWHAVREYDPTIDYRVDCDSTGRVVCCWHVAAPIVILDGRCVVPLPAVGLLVGRAVGEGDGDGEECTGSVVVRAAHPNCIVVPLPCVGKGRTAVAVSDVVPKADPSDLESDQTLDRDLFGWVIEHEMHNLLLPLVTDMNGEPQDGLWLRQEGGLGIKRHGDRLFATSNKMLVQGRVELTTIAGTVRMRFPDATEHERTAKRPRRSRGAEQKTTA